ncbi:Uncharacterised protein [uncultured archaeon]|nr:Uncharacterised protein [uncultured archaeon]
MKVVASPASSGEDLDVPSTLPALDERAAAIAQNLALKSGSQRAQAYLRSSEGQRGQDGSGVGDGSDDSFSRRRKRRKQPFEGVPEEFARRAAKDSFREEISSLSQAELGRLAVTLSKYAETGMPIEQERVVAASVVEQCLSPEVLGRFDREALVSECVSFGGVRGHVDGEVAARLGLASDGSEGALVREVEAGLRRASEVVGIRSDSVVFDAARAFELVVPLIGDSNVLRGVYSEIVGWGVGGRRLEGISDERAHLAGLVVRRLDDWVKREFACGLVAEGFNPRYSSRRSLIREAVSVADSCSDGSRIAVAEVLFDRLGSLESDDSSLNAATEAIGGVLSGVRHGRAVEDFLSTHDLRLHPSGRVRNAYAVMLGNLGAASQESGVKVLCASKLSDLFDFPPHERRNTEHHLDVSEVPFTAGTQLLKVARSMDDPADLMPVVDGVSRHVDHPIEFVRENAAAVLMGIRSHVGGLDASRVVLSEVEESMSATIGSHRNAFPGSEPQVDAIKKGVARVIRKHGAAAAKSDDPAETLGRLSERVFDGVEFPDTYSEGLTRLKAAIAGELADQTPVLNNLGSTADDLKAPVLARIDDALAHYPYHLAGDLVREDLVGRLIGRVNASKGMQHSEFDGSLVYHRQLAGSMVLGIADGVVEEASALRVLSTLLSNVAGYHEYGLPVNANEFSETLSRLCSRISSSEGAEAAAVMLLDRCDRQNYYWRDVPFVGLACGMAGKISDSESAGRVLPAFERAAKAWQPNNVGEGNSALDEVVRLCALCPPQRRAQVISGLVGDVLGKSDEDRFLGLIYNAPLTARAIVKIASLGSAEERVETVRAAVVDVGKVPRDERELLMYGAVRACVSDDEVKQVAAAASEILFPGDKSSPMYCATTSARSLMADRSGLSSREPPVVVEFDEATETAKRCALLIEDPTERFTAAKNFVPSYSFHEDRYNVAALSAANSVVATLNGHGVQAEYAKELLNSLRHRSDKYETCRLITQTVSGLIPQFSRQETLEFLAALPVEISAVEQRRDHAGVRGQVAKLAATAFEALGPEGLQEGLNAVLQTIDHPPKDSHIDAERTLIDIGRAVSDDSLLLSFARRIAPNLSDPYSQRRGDAAEALAEFGSKIQNPQILAELVALIEPSRQSPISEISRTASNTLTRMRDLTPTEAAERRAIITGAPPPAEVTDEKRLATLSELCAHPTALYHDESIRWVEELANGLNDPQMKVTAAEMLLGTGRRKTERRMTALVATLVEPEKLDGILQEAITGLSAGDGSRETTLAGLSELGALVPYCRNPHILAQVSQMRDGLIMSLCEARKLSSVEVGAISRILEETSAAGVSGELMNAFSAVEMPYDAGSLRLISELAFWTGSKIVPGTLPAYCTLDRSSFIFSPQSQEAGYTETVLASLKETVELGLITEKGLGYDLPIKDPRYKIGNAFHGRSSFSISEPTQGDTSSYARVFKANGTYYGTDGISFQWRGGQNEIHLEVHMFWGGDILKLSDIQARNALRIRKGLNDLYNQGDPHIRRAVEEFGAFPITEDGINPDAIYQPFGQFKPQFIPQWLNPEESKTGESIGRIRNIRHRDGLSIAGVPDEYIRGHRIIGYIVPVPERVGELTPIGQADAAWVKTFSYCGYQLIRQPGQIPRVMKDGQEVEYREAAREVLYGFASRWASVNYYVHHILNGALSNDFGSVYDDEQKHNSGFCLHDLDVAWAGDQYDAMHNRTPTSKPTLSNSREYYQREDDRNALQLLDYIAGLLRVPEMHQEAQNIFLEINPPSR